MPELKHVPIHIRRILAEPPVRIELMGIVPEDGLVVMHRGRTDAHPVSLGDQCPRDFRPARGHMARQREADARVQAHALFAAGLEVGQLDRFGVAHVGAAEAACELG